MKGRNVLKRLLATIYEAKHKRKAVNSKEFLV